MNIKVIDFGPGIDGNGNVTTQKRNLEGKFTKVDVSRSLKVTLVLPKLSLKKKVQAEAFPKNKLIKHLNENWDVFFSIFDNRVLFLN